MIQRKITATKSLRGNVTLFLEDSGDLTVVASHRSGAVSSRVTLNKTQASELVRFMLDRLAITIQDSNPEESKGA